MHFDLVWPIVAHGHHHVAGTRNDSEREGDGAYTYPEKDCHSFYFFLFIFFFYHLVIHDLGTQVENYFKGTEFSWSSSAIPESQN